MFEALWFNSVSGDCVEFLSWFLNSLHLSLGGGKKTGKTIISSTFRGRMRVYSRRVLPIDLVSEELLANSAGNVLRFNFRSFIENAET